MTTTTTNGIRATGYHILVKLQISKEVSDGGIIYADVTKEAQQMNISVGQVIDVGEHAFRDRNTGEYFAKQGPWCSVGDWVICPKFGTKRITLDGEPYSILCDDEVMAVLDDPSRLTAYV